MTLEKFSTFFCSGFGIGRLKYFPGTIASISVLPIVWVIKENFSLNLFISIIIIYTFFSIFFINHAIKKLKNKDPKFVVVDEHIGQAISLILCEQRFFEYLIAFIIFRFFDIVKPFPINIIDKKIKNSLGVILDDILAGFYTIIFCILIF
tara:strand:- start:2855 stop:3304 length:450 start_codon:yes stop_codon:yes gene_type:complete